MIVHTKQFLSFYSYFREIICLFALLQFCVKEFEKKLLQLNWSCWSALTSFYARVSLQVHQVSVSHCVSTNLCRGVQFFGNVNWIESFLFCQLLPTQIVFVIHLYSFFSLIKCGCSGLKVISFQSFYGGCRCEWLFRLQWPAGVSFGLQWPLEVITLWRQFVEADGLTAWGFSGLSRFVWAAVASRDNLACSIHGLFI